MKYLFNMALNRKSYIEFYKLDVNTYVCVFIFIHTTINQPLKG